MMDVSATCVLESAPPWIAIAPMRQQFVESYHECLDQVCREGKYLMNPEAPAFHLSQKFVRGLLENQLPMTVALLPGLRVIGWCDIYRLPNACQAHVGRLGLAVHADYRGQGLGKILLERTLRGALLAGLERVELEVFESNSRAIRLYEHFEFEIEGSLRKAKKMNGNYENILIMARVTPPIWKHV